MGFGTTGRQLPMIDMSMDLLALIVIVLALVAAAGILYAAWELSSDRPDRDNDATNKRESEAASDPIDR